ncbi:MULTISPECIES: glycoside hydrolase family 19 protein [unclassified Luteococcus]|uniref:glycoside hydrolase family 19 protein n=1 Tax=unclassified Luteococcus TaxID=2639923 RepID=UPI00313E8380
MTAAQRPVLLRSTVGLLASLTLAAGLQLPAQAPAEAAPADITHAQLKAMFGSRVSKHPRVAQNLGSLNREMRAAGITTPQRQAAFLSTLVNESRMDPAANERGVRSRYKGRGYIQLTGAWNYRAAGREIGVNLSRNPAAAASPRYSARIATWYWADLRPGSNRAADRFDMGRISRNVGYAYSAREDRERCADFKRAYKVLSGKNAPRQTVCARH